MRIINVTNVLFMATLLTIIAQPLYATPVNCIKNLTHNFSVDSAAYSINLDETEVREFGSDHLANGIQIIKVLIFDKGCERSDINFLKTPLDRNSFSRCKKLLENNDHSLVCFVESSIGYFFVTWDQLSRAHIIYNRWD